MQCMLARETLQGQAMVRSQVLMVVYKDLAPIGVKNPA